MVHVDGIHVHMTKYRSITINMVQNIWQYPAPIVQIGSSKLQYRSLIVIHLYLKKKTLGKWVLTGILN